LRTQLKKNIQKAADHFSIDPTLIAAIVEVESGGIGFRTRYEEHFSYFKDFQEHAARLGVTYMTEYIGQKTSWGHMQVMGATARECGFQLYLPELCLPEHGIWWGTLYLKRQMKRYEKSPTTETDAIAAYNAGSARLNNAGRYFNQGYVNKVAAARKRIVDTNALS